MDFFIAGSVDLVVYNRLIIDSDVKVTINVQTHNGNAVAIFRVWIGSCHEGVRTCFAYKHFEGLTVGRWSDGVFRLIYILKRVYDFNTFRVTGSIDGSRFFNID